jgi:membrane protein required for colicin V production
MLIDLLFAVFMLIAVVKGFREGLIVGLFSVIAFIVGLAAAIKLSAVVAAYLKDSVNVSAKWLPFLSFALVFIAVVLIIRWTAGLLQAAVEISLLGWVNRLGGVLFYIILYTLGFSVVLFFAVQLKLFGQETIDRSVVYDYIQPWGPFVINKLGDIIPWFRDMFSELQDFFSGVSEKIPPPSPAD